MNHYKKNSFKKWASLDYTLSEYVSESLDFPTPASNAQRTITVFYKA